MFESQEVIRAKKISHLFFLDGLLGQYSLIFVSCLFFHLCSCHTSWMGDDCSTRYVVHGVLLDDGQDGVRIIHVGGTRCATWSIDRITQIHACITWGVEFIRAIFFIFFFYV